MRGADLLVRSLMQAGVERIFTLSGNQIMPVFDACVDEPMDLIHVRHEAAAVHMADAWGRLTGEPGIALVTAGPGFLNAMSALYVATMAESPLVLISGASPEERAGQGAFQEVPQAEAAGHVAKASWQVSDPAQLGHDVARAIRTARSGRPGPVHLSVPGEVFSADVPQPPKSLPQPEDFQPLMSLLDSEAVEDILRELTSASHPVILAGPSLTRGGLPARLQELAEVINVPAVAMESPRGLKDPSLGRFRDVVANADVVLLLERSLNFTLRFGEVFRPDCRFLIVEPDMPTIEQARRNLGDKSRIAHTSLADPIPSLDRLLQAAQNSTARTDAWRSEFDAAVAHRPAEWETIASPADGPIHPADLCRRLQRFLAQDDNAVFVSDGGEFGQWAQACISTPHRVINGPSGSIGGGLSFAFAARLAFPDSRIVATVGDGTFGFHALEFDTAVRYNLPAIIVVGNDARWNAEHQIQIRDYGPDRTLGCELLATRYDQIAESLGGHGEHVTRPDDIEPALQRAFDSGKPACVNVMIDGLAAPE